MDLLIPDNWLRDYLDTKVSNKDLANMLSLSGPTVDRIQGSGKSAVYQIEVTTNRVDAACVYGIAREAVAILTRNGKKASLAKPKLAKLTSSKKLGVQIINSPKLCKRLVAIKLEGVQIGPSPKWFVERLAAVGQRGLNNVVDITNYCMWELGHPLHAFDYDVVAKGKIVVRTAKKGEELTSLDGNTHKMVGGEIVFDNGKGEIIDLPGIMGTKNSVVSESTKNVLLLFESCDPVAIRFASMTHAIRTQAATINEKSPASETGMLALLRAVKLFEELAGAKQGSALFDVNAEPYAPRTIRLTKAFLDSRMGIDVPKSDIKSYLELLGFTTSWTGENLTVTVPAFRMQDMNIPEDVVEEVARIYGYNNLPNTIMAGTLPAPKLASPFQFEEKIKQTLVALGGIEVYTYSLIPKAWLVKNGLALTNPLGSDSEYLRDNLRSSLLDAAKANSGELDPFHLFEMAKVYLPRTGQLPDEVLMLAGVFAKTNYRTAKGVVEALLGELGVTVKFEVADETGFQPSKHVKIVATSGSIGGFGVLENTNHIYYEFMVDNLAKNARTTKHYQELPKYPGQVEDLTLHLPERTKVGDVLATVLAKPEIVSVTLRTIYKDAYTFRVVYQSNTETLTNEQVATIREELVGVLETKFGASL